MLSLLLLVPCGAPERAVSIRFAATVGGAPFACGETYDGIGTTTDRKNEPRIPPSAHLPPRQPRCPSRRGAPTWWPEPEKTRSPCLAHGSAPGPACSRRPVVAHGVEPRRAGRAAKPVEDAPRGRRVHDHAAQRERAAAARAREAVYPEHPLQQVAPAWPLPREPHARMPREPLGAPRLGHVGGRGLGTTSARHAAFAASTPR